MKKIPLHQQWPKADPLWRAEWTLQLGYFPTNEELALAVQAAEALPPLLRDHLVLKIRGQLTEKTGRPPASQAKLYYLMDDTERLYPRAYQKFVHLRGRQRARRKRVSDKSDIQLAYELLLKRFKLALPNRDWKTLRNLHIRWRKGKLLGDRKDSDGKTVRMGPH